MLVLSRKVGEEIAIDGVITIRILSVERGVVRLGIEAPRNVPIYRRELYQVVEQLNRRAMGAKPPVLATVLRQVRLYSPPPLTEPPTLEAATQPQTDEGR